MNLRHISLSLLLATVSTYGADLTGTWILNSKDSDGNPVKSEITFRQEGDRLKAKLTSKNVQQEIERIKREGDQVTFEMEWQDDQIMIQLEASGDTLKGKWEAGEDNGTIDGMRAATTTTSPLAGLWKLTAERPNGSSTKVELTLSSAATWQATLRTSEGASVPLDKVTVADNLVSFLVAMPQGNIKIELKLQGEVLKGTWTSADQASGPVEGRR